MYYDKKAQERDFSVGDRVLVYFPSVPVGVNPKFYKKWRGLYTVVRKISPLNLELKSDPGEKSVYVHVDRVKMVDSEEKRRYCDSKRVSDVQNVQDLGAGRAEEADDREPDVQTVQKRDMRAGESRYDLRSRRKGRGYR